MIIPSFLLNTIKQNQILRKYLFKSLVHDVLSTLTTTATASGNPRLTRLTSDGHTHERLRISGVNTNSVVEISLGRTKS